MTELHELVFSGSDAEVLALMLAERRRESGLEAAAVWLIGRAFDRLAVPRRQPAEVAGGRGVASAGAKLRPTCRPAGFIEDR